LVNYENKLGSGAFGDVYSGRLVGDAAIKNVYRDSPLLAKFHDCKIAIKTVPTHADDWARNDFQQEMNFMKSLKFHPHLVCMLGHVWDPTSPLLILEFCANGDLLQFLRKKKDKFSNVSFFALYRELPL
jgi:serine/threonine protein kinase